MQHRTAEPGLRVFENLVLGGCIDKAEEGYDGTCIEGNKSHAEVEFFTIYRNLIGGGFKIITGGSDFYEAQRVAAHLCDLSGLTLKIEC